MITNEYVWMHLISNLGHISTPTSKKVYQKPKAIQNLHGSSTLSGRLTWCPCWDSDLPLYMTHRHHWSLSERKCASFLGGGWWWWWWWWRRHDVMIDSKWDVGKGKHIQDLVEMLKIISNKKLTQSAYWCFGTIDFYPRIALPNRWVARSNEAATDATTGISQRSFGIASTCMDGLVVGWLEHLWRES